MPHPASAQRLMLHKMRYVASAAVYDYGLVGLDPARIRQPTYWWVSRCGTLRHSQPSGCRVGESLGELTSRLEVKISQAGLSLQQTVQMERQIHAQQAAHTVGSFRRSPVAQIRQSPATRFVAVVCDMLKQEHLARKERERQEQSKRSEGLCRRDGDSGDRRGRGAEETRRGSSCFPTTFSKGRPLDIGKGKKSFVEGDRGGFGDRGGGFGRRRNFLREFGRGSC